MELIGLIPKTGWKAADVGKAYQQLAKQYGVPEAILVDGAAELRDGAEYLRKTGRKVLVRRDLKHFLANQMESLIGKDSRFSEFTKQVVSTRSAVQQTELSHLTPASAKQKARFMNLQPTLKWASMILWQLDHPEAEGRSGVSADRFEAKLGWLREYREDIEQWLQCQHAVSLGVKFANEQGLYQGASGAFQKLSAAHAQGPKSRDLVQRTVTFIKDREQGLRRGQRLPFSTEIIESCFGCYKQLEGQHSKGGLAS